MNAYTRWNRLARRDAICYTAGMKPAIFAVAVLACAAASEASPNPVNTPIVSSSGQASESKPSNTGKDAVVSYASADRSLAELNRGVNHLAECVAAYEFLAASAAKAEKKYTGADGTVPSHMAALIPMKRKMADDKRVACITEGNALGNQFSAVRNEFAEFEPRNAKGLPARRLELTEMRGKANAIMARIGAKPAKPSRAPKPTKASDTDEGAAEDEQ